MIINIIVLKILLQIDTNNDFKFVKINETVSVIREEFESDF